MAIHTYKIKIFGKVQKVGFRKFIFSAAEKLELTGFVKNEIDETLLIKASGELQNLQKLFEICKIGPERAKIELVEIEEIDRTFFREFEIKY